MFYFCIELTFVKQVSAEIENASERETIKEQNMEEESCTKELHMLPAADNEVSLTYIQSKSFYTIPLHHGRMHYILHIVSFRGFTSIRN